MPIGSSLKSVINIHSYKENDNICLSVCECVCLGTCACVRRMCVQVNVRVWVHVRVTMYTTVQKFGKYIFMFLKEKEKKFQSK